MRALFTIESELEGLMESVDRVLYAHRKQEFASLQTHDPADGS